MRTGRPPKIPEDRLVPVSLRIPAGMVEAIDRQALRECKSTAMVIREALAAVFPYLKSPLSGEPS